MQLKSIEDEIVASKSKLKFSMDDGLFIIKLGNELKKNNVLLNIFQPKEIVKNNNFLTLPINIGIRGDYRDVKKILVYLENNSNHTEVTSLSFVSQHENGQKQSIQNRLLLTPDGIPQESAQNALLNGRISAEIAVAIYSLPTPEDRLALEGIQKWRIGSDNPFVSP